MLKILLCVSLLGAGACADDPASDRTYVEPGSVSDPNTPATPGDDPDVPQVQAIMGNEAQCLSDGPCSPACAGNMPIDIHVPTGECVYFDCSGEGGPSDVGGCHP